MRSGRMPLQRRDMQTEDPNRRGWEWIDDGTRLTLVDREYWERIGRRAGVSDPYRAKAAFLCGAIREFLTTARVCFDAQAFLGASLLLMPPLEVFGRCVTGDRADGRGQRIIAGVNLLNELQHGAAMPSLDPAPITKLRNFLAGGAVAMDQADPVQLDQPTLDRLGRGLALALDQYWADRQRCASFARTRLTALQAAGNPIYIADMARHFASGHRPSDGLAWTLPST
jgi:hypothetical protein